MATMPDPFPSLLARIKRIEKRQDQHSAASPFWGTGVHPNGQQGLDSDNYVPATSGFSLKGGAGTAEFRDILLYDLPNSMLANPVVPGIVSDSSSGFAMTTTNATKLSGIIAVPPGYTKAAVSVVARTFALDGDTTQPVDYLYSSVTIGGTSSPEVPLAVTNNGGSGTSISPLSVVLTSLGATVAFSVTAHTAFTNWGSDAFNAVQLSGSILWFR